MSIKKKSDEMLTSNVVKYLKQLSKIHSDEVTGNIKLSKALVILSNHLNKYSTYPITEAISRIEKRTIVKTEKIVKKERQNIQIDYSEITKYDIRKILNSDISKKEQLIELGYIKFGIPKSGMLRLNKQDIIDRIKSALAHSDSISIISDAAKDGGNIRKS